MRMIDIALREGDWTIHAMEVAPGLAVGEVPVWNGKRHTRGSGWWAVMHVRSGGCAPNQYTNPEAAVAAALRLAATGVDMTVPAADVESQMIDWAVEEMDRHGATDILTLSAPAYATEEMLVR